MFSGRPSVPLSIRPCVRACVCPSVRDSRGSFMFPRYLQYLLTDLRQTFVTGASWDTDDLITFLGQRVRVQGHTIAAEAHSTLRCRRVQLFLVDISGQNTGCSTLWQPHLPVKATEGATGLPRFTWKMALCVSLCPSLSPLCCFHYICGECVDGFSRNFCQ